MSKPNEYTIRSIISSVKANVSDVVGYESIPCTELDSHANMMVLGKHSFIFESTGKTCLVRLFSEEMEIADDVAIVDGAIAYDDPDTGKTYVVLVRNAPYIPSMDSDLIPPFIMRISGIKVKDTPKVYCTAPIVEDHLISFEDINLRIQLQLKGIFSFFYHRIPTSDELQGCDKVFLMPDSTSWNPHCKSFARNEQSMLDFEGSIAKRYRQIRYLMEPDKDDYSLAEVFALDWGSTVDDNGSTSFQADELDNLNEVSDLAEALSLRGEISKMFGSIGTCSAGIKAPDDLFDDKPIFTTHDDLEKQFSKELSSTMSAAHA